MCTPPERSLLFTVLFWQDFKIRFKCRGKFAVAVIAHGLCDFSDTHLGLTKHFGSLFHAVLFDVGSYRGSVNGLECSL